MATRSIFLAAGTIFWCGYLSAGPTATEPSPPTERGSNEGFIKSLSPERRKEFEAMEEENRLAEKYRVRDRKEFVRPAPPGFKPEDARRRLKLTLIPERTMIRKGKRLHYQAGIQNVGRENVLFSDRDSFVLRGLLGGKRFKFILVRENGEEWELLNLNGRRFPPDSDDEFHPPPGWERMSSQEKDEAIRLLNIEGRLKSEFVVELKPGETIFTRDPKTGARFTDLSVTHGLRTIEGSKRALPVFEQAGTWRIKLVYDDRPPAPPSGEQFEIEINVLGSKEKVLKNYQETVDRSLGLIESNIVAFEVAQ